MQFTARKILFKAWNQETKLLMRLNSIDCIKGELFRRNHILLQFTGLHDKQNEEIYEMDLVLIGNDKFVVSWDTVQNGWGLSPFPDSHVKKPFVKEVSQSAIRLCNYFESEKAG